MNLPLTHKMIEIKILLLCNRTLIHSPNSTHCIHLIAVQANGVVYKITVLLNNTLNSLVDGVLLLILLEMENDGSSTRSIRRLGNFILAKTNSLTPLYEYDMNMI